MPRSVMPPSARFAQVPQANISRSTFDRSHGHKTTFDAGVLVPVLIDEVLPGDTVNCRMTAFARLATPLKPLMDNMFLESFFFFCPNRLIWDNWEKFNGAQDDPGDSTDYSIPRVADGAVVSSGLNLDYMGIPIGLDTTNERINSLPLRAQALIWNEWFRDQNLQDSIAVAKDDGPDIAADFGGFSLFKRGKRHDYFTSCLPWPQKGDALDLPLGTAADVATDAAVGGDISVYSTTRLANSRMQANATSREIELENTTAGSKLYADLTTATGATINQLRQTFQMQKLLERDARGGTRYKEIILAHFGVVSPDARLNRPEYLGGGSTPVNIQPVPQTSETGTSAQGNLAAFGTVQAGGHGFVKSFTEHGYIIGFVSVRADLTYQQGLERMWSRVTREDHFWPAMQHIGEQAVLQKEIYIANDASDDDVFGYQERYAEYRYKPSKITGLFRSGVAGSLDIWHLSQEFSGPPTLNDIFIEEDVPLDRVIATPTEPHFLFDSYFRYTWARPMPVYGVPGFIDHF